MTGSITTFNTLVSNDAQPPFTVTFWTIFEAAKPDADYTLFEMYKVGPVNIFSLKYVSGSWKFSDSGDTNTLTCGRDSVGDLATPLFWKIVYAGENDLGLWVNGAQVTIEPPVFDPKMSNVP